MARATRRGLVLINASLKLPAGAAAATTLRVCGGRIEAVGCEPRRGDRVLDLHGDRLLPGLINAHDHLQLNSFPRLEYQRRFRNVSEWVADISGRLETDRPFRAARELPRDQRLLHGGIKNLLSGVTTVAHHDPLYPALVSPRFPVRVVRHFGWSHSLGIDGDLRVRRSHERTPGRWPWIIHAAEGLDRDAAAEFDRLDALGCVAANTLLVHGLGLDAGQRARLAAARAGLIWCPTSNLRLYGRSAVVAELAAQGRVALGSDSRLTGADDLLGELRRARQLGGTDEATLESLVTESGARLLRLRDRGVIATGARADLLVLPRRIALPDAVRSDIRMLMIGGRVRYADPDVAASVAAQWRWWPVTVDGRRKALDRALTARLSQAGIRESGLELCKSACAAA